MRTNVTKDAAGFADNRPFRNLKMNWMTLLVFALLLLGANSSFAHCDTMEGPLVLDAQKAIRLNNVNIVLKWVPVDQEAEIREAFKLASKVRGLSREAGELADKYFFDTLVRIHRAGEGMPFTGVKPKGTPIEETVKAADQSIALGNLTPLKNLVPEGNKPELEKRFAQAMSLKNFDANDVEAGRKYVEAYIRFFKFAEGEAEEGSIHQHEKKETATPVHRHTH